MKTLLLVSSIVFSLSCYSQRTSCKIDTVLCYLHPLGSTEHEKFFKSIDSNTSSAFTPLIVFEHSPNNSFIMVYVDVNKEYIIGIDEYIGETKGETEDGIIWIERDFKCSQHAYDLSNDETLNIDVHVKYIRFQTGRLRFVFKFPSYTLIYDGEEDENVGTN